MTMQVREILVHRGQRREVVALPLHNCGRLVPDVGGFSTACHRGYQGVWEVRDDALHLAGLHFPFGEGEDERDRLTDMFPGSAGPVEASWFSGEIVPDDVIDPKGGWRLDLHQSNGWPCHFLRFTLVIHRGKLLSEVTTDLESGVTEARLTRHADGLFPAAEVAFLRAIHADLDDRTPKLVYADWLDERDDPRGARLREEVARQEKEGAGRTRVERNVRWDIPSGSVPPEDLLWYWCRLADIPEPTPEDRQYQELIERLKPGG